MKLLSRLLIILGFASSAVLADECTRISDLNSIYRSIIKSTASELSVKRLQQIVGVTADGVWGPRSELAFNNLISKKYFYKNKIIWSLGKTTQANFNFINLYISLNNIIDHQLQ